MLIELHYTDGCPSWQQGLENLRVALDLENITAQVRLVKIKDDAEAAKFRFLGSPSFQVDGQDLWPEERESFFLSCRLYQTTSGMLGAPSVEMLRAKIRDLSTNS